jgi:S1-C subfamily serine protease
MAGLVRGDIIMDVNGTAVNSQSDIRQAIASHKQGDSVSLKVRHGDAEKTLTVALGEKNGRPYIGAFLFPPERWSLSMRGPEDRKSHMGFFQGALVAGVASGGPADKAGITRGDIILSVDGIPIDADHSLSALIQAKNIGDTVTLSVKGMREPADKAPREVKVALGSTPDKKKPRLGVEYRQASPQALLPGGSFPPAAELLPPDGGPSQQMPGSPELNAPGAPAPVL